jgi:hypothetical protein
VTSREELGLSAGEKVVWQSRGGGPAGYGQWVYVVAVLVGLNLCGSVAFIPLAILGASSDAGRYDEYGEPTPQLGLGAQLLASLPSLFCTGISIAFVVAAVFVAIKPRLRPSFFLTQERFFAAKLFGGYESWPLARIREMRQYVAVYHGRYGQRQEVATNRVELRLDSGAWVKAGPIADLQALLDLYDNAIATRWVELDALPEVGGAPAPGEARPDLLFVARTSTAAMQYGPLFVGPTRVVRFTEVPEAHLLARLYSLLARPGTAEELEEVFVASARAGTFGHFVDVARDEARPAIDGDVVTLRLGERHEPVQLARADAERARTFLSRRSAYRD